MPLLYNIKRKPFPESPTLLRHPLFSVELLPGSKQIIIPDEVAPFMEICNKQGDHDFELVGPTDKPDNVLKWGERIVMENDE